MASLSLKSLHQNTRGRWTFYYAFLTRKKIEPMLSFNVSYRNCIHLKYLIRLILWNIYPGGRAVWNIISGLFLSTNAMREKLWVNAHVTKANIIMLHIPRKLYKNETKLQRPSLQLWTHDENQQWERNAITNISLAACDASNKD